MTIRTRSRVAAEGDRKANLCQVLLQLVDGGFIAPAELGALSLVCRSLNEFIADDSNSLWSCLIQKKFGIGASLSRQFLLPGTPGDNAVTDRFLFFRLAVPVICREALNPPPSLAPPRCDWKDFHFLLTLSYEGEPITVGFQLQGLPRCFNLPIPIVLGKAEFNFTEQQKMDYANGMSPQGLPVTCANFHAEKLDACLAMSRRDKINGNVAIINVFDSKRMSTLDRKSTVLDLLAHPSESVVVSKESLVDMSKSQENGVVGIFEVPRPDMVVCPLSRTCQGNEMVRRLKNPIRLSVLPYFKVLDGNVFAITSFSIFPTKYDVEGSTLTCSMFGEADEKESGVSMLHILSELQD